MSLPTISTTAPKPPKPPQWRVQLQATAMTGLKVLGGVVLVLLIGLFAGWNAALVVAVLVAAVLVAVRFKGHKRVKQASRLAIVPIVCGVAAVFEGHSLTTGFGAGIGFDILWLFVVKPLWRAKKKVARGGSIL